ncbi:hypothetical protein ACIP2X_06615 [Streptomyces sp. NPDC089424]|uniref:hypothetical protein n=1 Tax=Streptomyces sp. NPDC089424 TaxID=3365917 RepID=UPI00380DA577
MAPKTDHLIPSRAVRQLRRVRAFYAGGALLWAAAAWTGWANSASRQMWVSLLLLVVFSALLFTASVWLRRLRAATAADRPAHHAAPRRAVGPRHASA